MQKKALNVIGAKQLTTQNMKSIKGGGLVQPFYCNLNINTYCVPFDSRALCIASGCPSAKCSRFTLCPA